MSDFPLEKAELADFCTEHKITLLGLFDADAFIDTDDEDDIEFFVQFAKAQGRASAITLERHLGRALGRSVSLVTAESVTPHMRKQIQKDLAVVFRG